MSACRLPSTKSRLLRFADTSTQLRRCDSNHRRHSRPRSQHKALSQPQSRCKLTRCNGREVPHLLDRPAFKFQCRLGLPAEIHNPEERKLRCRFPRALGPGSARCVKTPISSELLSWRWLCARAANWTIRDQDGPAGRSLQGSSARSRTRWAPMEFQQDGFQSRIELWTFCLGRGNTCSFATVAFSPLAGFLISAFRNRGYLAASRARSCRLSNTYRFTVCQP